MTTWADIDGDGKADMICDDLGIGSNGNHWVFLSSSHSDKYPNLYQFEIQGQTHHD